MGKASFAIAVTRRNDQVATASVEDDCKFLSGCAYLHLTEISILMHQAPGTILAECLALPDYASSLQ
jgi:hypothetical protein